MSNTGALITQIIYSSKKKDDARINVVVGETGLELVTF